MEKESKEKEFREKIKQVKDSPFARKIASEEGIYIGDKNKVDWMTIFSFGFFIILLINIWIGLYYVGQGKFQSIINQGDVNVNPLYNTTTNVNTSYAVDNDYEFNPYHNVTIINNVFTNCT